MFYMFFIFHALFFIICFVVIDFQIANLHIMQKRCDNLYIITSFYSPSCCICNAAIFLRLRLPSKQGGRAAGRFFESAVEGETVVKADIKGDSFNRKIL